MTPYETAMTDVFERYTEKTLTLAEEREAIELAVVFGDDDAMVTLLYAYAPLLANLARPHEARLGKDDARAVVVAEFYAAIRAFQVRGDERVGTFVKTRILSALSDADTGLVTVPSRTARRFFHVLRQAGGDRAIGRILAPTFGMTEETFDAVSAALSISTTHLGEHDEDGDDAPRSPARVSGLWQVPEDPYATVEDHELASAARASVVGLERRVVEYAYGFETGDPMSDGEVAQALSVDELGPEAVASGQYIASRPKVQRTRSSALRTMRAELGISTV